MGFLANLLPLSSDEREELRKLRIKCATQEKWISQRLMHESKPLIRDAQRTALSVLQRRVDMMRADHPDIWHRYFSKEANRK